MGNSLIQLFGTSFDKTMKIYTEFGMFLSFLFLQDYAPLKILAIMVDVDVDETDGYICECPPGLTGPTCTDVDHCAASPCQNNGTCINEADGYRCECPFGYKGPECADMDYCAENLCQNGGTCVDGPGSFTCNCTENYRGPTCQLSRENNLPFKLIFDREKFLKTFTSWF